MAAKIQEELKRAANALWLRAEQSGLVPRRATFDRDYADDYPALRALEAGYPYIRDECEQLLGIRERMVDVAALAGSYTSGGVHVIRWKSFMFKSGEFIEENCRLAPRTTALLRQIPGLYTAFFSVLEPGQYIAPHWGYWKGFARYHLGVVVPNDNVDERCWIRINRDPEVNRARARERIDEGERYCWHEGEGVMFDDTFLHDACNDASEVRVVLFLDIRRRMPVPLDLLNAAILEVAHRLPAVARVRRNAVIAPGGD